MKTHWLAKIDRLRGVLRGVVASGQKGISIPELLIASVISSIVILGASRAFISANSATNEIVERELAQAEALKFRNFFRHLFQAKRYNGYTSSASVGGQGGNQSANHIWFIRYHNNSTVYATSTVTVRQTCKALPGNRAAKAIKLLSSNAVAKAAFDGLASCSGITCAPGQYYSIEIDVTNPQAGDAYLNGKTKFNYPALAPTGPSLGMGICFRKASNVVVNRGLDSYQLDLATALIIADGSAVSLVRNQQIISEYNQYGAYDFVFGESVR